MKKYEINIFENMIHIKNYKKICSISDEIICIELFEFLVKIKGKSLIIVGIDEFEICINGFVYNIEFLYE